MRIRLNLATNPWVSDRRFTAGAALVGTLALVALVLLSWRAYVVRRADRAYRAEVSQLQREMRDLETQRQALEKLFNDPKTIQLRDRAAFLNTMIEQRSFPWTKIFMDLENRLPDGVRVIDIAPRMAKGHVEVRLTVGATTDEAKLKFLRALENAPEFSRVQLVSESRTTQANDPDRVQMQLVTWYVTT